MNTLASILRLSAGRGIVQAPTQYALREKICEGHETVFYHSARRDDQARVTLKLLRQEGPRRVAMLEAS